VHVGQVPFRTSGYSYTTTPPICIAFCRNPDGGNISTQYANNVPRCAWPNQPTQEEKAQRNVHIHFVARALSSQWPDIERLDESDIARHAQRFRGGVNNWIVQTYLRLRDPLRRADIFPTIGDALVPGCINIAHRDSLNRLLTPYHRSYVVGIRADRPPLHSCNWEIAQNDLAPKRSRMRYLP
jgi:hypothetical protein